jgi:arginase family enzyme
MDLTIFFSPIDESIYTKSYPSNSFFKSIKVYGDKMPDFRGVDVAVFGVKEERGTASNAGCSKGPDEIRKKLYNLKKEMVPTASLTWEISIPVLILMKRMFESARFAAFSWRIM